ncbi:hypothetical protein B566_EDAN007427 [Ephemera danica]|nr:hypothetical protein B566_EDAN007427 [Ephemera danica]
MPVTTLEPDWMDAPFVGGMRVWQLLFAISAGLSIFGIFLCCCIRFRIPRTKEEIEADYVRKKIARKFRRQLRLIRNSDMDEMDLKRGKFSTAEFKSDTESLAQSEALSVASLSSARSASATYRKASDILMNMSLDQLPQDRSITTRLSALVDAALATLRIRKRHEGAGQTELTYAAPPKHDMHQKC